MIAKDTAGIPKPADGKLKSYPTVLLFNPKATSFHPRMPNSILTLMASLPPGLTSAFVDGNLEREPWEKIRHFLSSGSIGCFCCTVMPGPQLGQAVRISRLVRKHFPSVFILWGGYFPSIHPRVVADSHLADYIFVGPAGKAFSELIRILPPARTPETLPVVIRNGAWNKVPGNTAVPTGFTSLQKEHYEQLAEYYPPEAYLPRTWLGQRTLGYHSSEGCPFCCDFCGVAALYHGKWVPEPVPETIQNLDYFKNKFRADSVEFHDNNFFADEKRVSDFCTGVEPLHMNWWAEGRVDTLLSFSDQTLKAMARSGCRMIFAGAESTLDENLEQMNKGGRQTSDSLAALCQRLRVYGILPELSFVLGLPEVNPAAAVRKTRQEISNIIKLKSRFPEAQIILYVYSPVPLDGHDLYRQAVQEGFRFPDLLDEWLSGRWKDSGLRRKPNTPWLQRRQQRIIHNFESVLNARYPLITDVRLGSFARGILRLLSGWRWMLRFFAFPYEIRAFQKWLAYRQPEKEGM